jgi:hypothetical protein
VLPLHWQRPQLAAELRNLLFDIQVS